MQGEKVYGRTRTMLLDWLLKTEEGNISYEELKTISTRRIKMASMKTQTCHIDRILQRVGGRER